MQAADARDPQALAELCLGHLAESPPDLLRFMQETGYEPDSLRAALGSEALARALIDHFAANEPMLLALCANAGMEPLAFMRAWRGLDHAR